MYCVVVESLNNVSGHFAFSLETYKHVQHKKWPMHNYEVVILTLKYHIYEKNADRDYLTEEEVLLLFIFSYLEYSESAVLILFLQ